MSKIPLQVPKKTSRNHEILGRRGNVLQWFTRSGWANIPDDLRYNGQGKQIRVPKGGWVEVKEDDFEAPPAPLTPADVVKTPVEGLVTSSPVVAEKTGEVKEEAKGPLTPADEGSKATNDEKLAEAKENIEAADAKGESNAKAGKASTK